MRVTGHIVAEPRGRNKSIGSVAIGELHLYQHQTFVTAMKDIQFCHKSHVCTILHLATQINAIAGLGNMATITF